MLNFQFKKSIGQNEQAAFEGVKYFRITMRLTEEVDFD